MLDILSEHTKQNAPWSWENDALEDIYKKLEIEHDIRPGFEEYGGHIDYNPKWLKPEAEEKYKGCVYIFTSPYVRLITDEKEIIVRCEKAINDYKATKEYKKIRSEHLKIEAERERIRKELIQKLNNSKTLCQR